MIIHFLSMLQALKTANAKYQPLEDFTKRMNETIIFVETTTLFPK